MLHKSGRACSIRARCTNLAYELNRTRARWAFKQLLGQANHFLITVLVGLNGVRSGVCKLEDEFRTSWNPKDTARSADRSRVFVLDLALVRAIDAFDTYMMYSVRKPCALPNTEFLTEMGQAGRSVRKRFSVFDKHLKQLDSPTKAALDIAIEWRNRRVHSLANDKIDKNVKNALLDHSEHFERGYSGLKIDELISHFDAGVAPTFKEAAAIIRLCHEVVAHYDEFLLQQLDIEQYLKASLLHFIDKNGGTRLLTIQKTWKQSPKKNKKVIRLLRMVGVNRTSTPEGRKVPESFVNYLTNLESDEVVNFIQE